MTVQNIMVGVAQKMFCGDPILFGSTQFCGDPELPGSFDWPFLLRRKPHFGEAMKFEWIGRDIGVKTTFDWELLRIGGGRSCRRDSNFFKGPCLLIGAPLNRSWHVLCSTPTKVASFIMVCKRWPAVSSRVQDVDSIQLVWVLRAALHNVNVNSWGGVPDDDS